MMRLFTYTCLPSGRVSYLLMESIFAVLKVDQHQMQRFGVVLSKSFSHLRSLYQSALLLLRVFYKHPEYRDHCGHSFLECFHHLAATKSAWKPYHMDSTDENARVSTVTYAFLTCIQSLGTDNTADNTSKDITNVYYQAIKIITSNLLQVSNTFLCTLISV